MADDFLVFENQEIEIHYIKRASDTVLISFSAVNHKEDKRSLTAEKQAEAAEYSLVAVTAKRNNWFPEWAVEAARETVAAIVSAYTHRIAYGHSMGAYGAIRYSGLFKCTAVLALAPQFTIDPATLGRKDMRFASYFKEHNAGMDIKSDHVSGRIFVLADPKCLPDKVHIDLLADSISLDLVPAYYCGHDVVWALASTPVMLALFAAARDQDVSLVLKAYRLGKKSVPSYKALLLQAFSLHRLKQARLTSAFRAANLSSLMRVNHPPYLITLKKVCTASGWRAEAVMYARLAYEKAGQTEYSAYEMADALVFAHCRSEAVEVNRKALLGAPNSRILMDQQVRLMKAV